MGSVRGCAVSEQRALYEEDYKEILKICCTIKDFVNRYYVDVLTESFNQGGICLQEAVSLLVQTEGSPKCLRFKTPEPLYSRI